MAWTLELKISVEGKRGHSSQFARYATLSVEYTYEQFYKDARAVTAEIITKVLVPIVVGGTRMYMHWFMHNRKALTLLKVKT